MAREIIACWPGEYKIHEHATSGFEAYRGARTEFTLERASVKPEFQQAIKRLRMLMPAPARTALLDLGSLSTTMPLTTWWR